MCPAQGDTAIMHRSESHTKPIFCIRRIEIFCWYPLYAAVTVQASARHIVVARHRAHKLRGQQGVILVGILVTLLGFVISLLSLTLKSVGGRLALILFGLAVSLFGIIGILNKAYLKNAIWKKG
jgi:hypothetical protein